MTSFREQVRETLENYKPTKPGRTFGAGQTQEEFELALGEFRWCDPLKVAVVPVCNDCYDTVDASWIADRASEFLEERHAWALQQADKAADDPDSDGQEVKRWGAYAKACAKDNGSLSNRDKLVKAVTGSYANRIDTERLDSSPILLGTPQGAVDIRCGRLVVDDEYYSDVEIGTTASRFYTTKCTNADSDSEYMNESFKYDKRWDRFISEIMCGDAERADYLQRALGYSIYGGNPEECMFVAYGPTTRNGKNTLLDSVQHALGDYATSTESNFLLESRRSGGTDEALASLVGKRFVTMSEPTKNVPMDASRVKALCSCDYQSTSKKYGSQFTFRPQMTMWLSCNHLPTVNDDSVFASHRIRVIPFERHFDSNDQDKDLKDRFQTTNGAYTVLQWLLAGYRKYKERGLEEPESIKHATSSYADSGGSTVDKFLRQCCVIETGARCENNMFQGAYKDFCENILGADPMTANGLKKALEPYGIIKRRGHPEWNWIGVRLAVDAEPTLCKKEPAPNSKRTKRGIHV